MNFFSILTLFGGLAMFLYGMRLMGDGLKNGASGTLKTALGKVTDNLFKAFFLGFFLTALIQSSTATIVITSGLVAAGILTLRQSLGIIIGANVGTTVTGQIIRLLDLDASGTSWMQIFKPSSLAPIALIIGIVVLMSGKMKNANVIGSIAIGFGILFSGLLNMTGAVDTLADTGLFDSLFSGLGSNPLIGYLTGAGVAFLLQSSSATVGILQAFSASGQLTFKAIYAVIVGVYLGDCVTTAIVCSIGAPAESRRVGIVNILYNLGKSALVLVAVNILHAAGLLDSLWNETVNSGIIANTNTIFNLVSAVLLFGLLPVFEKLSYRIIPQKPEPANPYQEKLDALNPVFFSTPALALNSCYEILRTMFSASWENIRRAYGMLWNFDAKTRETIDAEEANIDLMTDRLSHYMVELAPHLTEDRYVAIMNQYYKVVAEFERLGDRAVHIADTAQAMDEGNASFSDQAKGELQVMADLTHQILDWTQQAFEKRDVKAAYHIEPLEVVAAEMTDTLTMNHLHRLTDGTCSVFADAHFMNLLGEIKHIADICSNVGVATVVRVNPELASQEHGYFETLRSGHDEKFNERYNRAREEFFTQLQILQRQEDSSADIKA